jgi:hypothetical protein
MVQLSEGTVLMFGGTNKNVGSREFMSDTWLFEYPDELLSSSSATWREIEPPHSGGGGGGGGGVGLVGAWPIGRMGHAMTSMGVNKALLYGGCVGDEYHSTCVTFLQDLWMFTGRVAGSSLPHGTWLAVNAVDLGTCGTGPGMRAMHSMAWLSSSVLVRIVFVSLLFSLHLSYFFQIFGGFIPFIFFFFFTAVWWTD